MFRPFRMDHYEEKKFRYGTNIDIKDYYTMIHFSMLLYLKKKNIE